MRVQTFNIRDDESSEEAFNNPVCLQGRVTPPCCGKVEGGQQRLFFNEQVLVWCLSADQRKNNLGVPARRGHMWTKLWLLWKLLRLA